MVDTDPLKSDRGILTKKDREYLLGEVDFSEYERPENQEQVIRSRIRKRIELAIKDFILIDEHLPAEEWDRILEEWREAQEEVKSQASRTGEAPKPSERPEVLRGLHAAMRCVLDSFGMVGGRHYAFMAVQDSLKQAVQTQSVIQNDEFYYGELKFDTGDLENDTIDLETAYEILKSATEKQEENHELGEVEQTLFEILDEFVDELPDMSGSDYIGLIDALYHKNRISQRDYEMYRNMMWEMVWGEKKSAINEALDDWNLILDREQ